MTLSDLSAEMLALSRRINPELEHVQGDMRSLRVPGAQFDAVFVHDAASYLASEDDVRAMAATAAFHCRPGGAAVVVPDHVREKLRPAVRRARRPRLPRRARHALPHVDHRPRPRRLDLHCRLRLPAARRRWDCPRRARPARLRHLPRGAVDRRAPGSRFRRNGADGPLGRPRLLRHETAQARPTAAAFC